MNNLHPLFAEVLKSHFDGMTRLASYYERERNERQAARAQEAEKPDAKTAPAPAATTGKDEQ